MDFFSQISSHLTPVEITLAVIFGTFVAIVRWAEKQALRYTVKTFQSEKQKRMHRHVHSGHRGSFKRCTQPECQPEAGAIAITEDL